MANQYTKAKAPTPEADQNFAHVILGPSNDELAAQQAQAEAKRKASGYPKVEVLRDTTVPRPEASAEKIMDGWEDIEFDPLGMLDPMASLKKAFQKPGMALKLMSESVNNRLGQRGYRVVKDENGDPVRMGKMVLGEIPERFAKARRQAAIEKSNSELGQINNAQRDAVEKLKQDAGSMGLSVIAAGDSITNQGDGQTYDMGLTVQRDEAPAQ